MWLWLFLASVLSVPLGQLGPRDDSLIEVGENCICFFIGDAKRPTKSAQQCCESAGAVSGRCTRRGIPPQPFRCTNERLEGYMVGDHDLMSDWKKLWHFVIKANNEGLVRYGRMVFDYIETERLSQNLERIEFDSSPQLCEGGDGVYDPTTLTIHVCKPTFKDIKKTKQHLLAALDIIYYEAHNARARPQYATLLQDFQKQPSAVKLGQRGMPLVLSAYGKRKATIECQLTWDYGLEVERFVKQNQNIFKPPPRMKRQLIFLNLHKQQPIEEVLDLMINSRHDPTVPDDAGDLTLRSLTTWDFYTYQRVESSGARFFFKYLEIFIPEFKFLRSQKSFHELQLLEEKWWSTEEKERPQKFVLLINRFLKVGYTIPEGLEFTEKMKSAALKECGKASWCSRALGDDSEIVSVVVPKVVTQEGLQCDAIGTDIVVQKPLGGGEKGLTFLLTTGDVIKLMDKTLYKASADRERTAFELLCAIPLPFFVPKATDMDPYFYCLKSSFAKDKVMAERMPDQWLSVHEIQATCMQSFENTIDNLSPKMGLRQRKALLLQIIFASAEAFFRHGYVQKDALPQNYGYRPAKKGEEIMCLQVGKVVHCMDLRETGVVQLFDFDKTELLTEEKRNLGEAGAVRKLKFSGITIGIFKTLLGKEVSLEGTTFIELFNDEYFNEEFEFVEGGTTYVATLDWKAPKKED